MSKGRDNTILNRIMEYKYRTYSSIIFGEKKTLFYMTWMHVNVIELHSTDIVIKTKKYVYHPIIFIR